MEENKKTDFSIKRVLVAVLIVVISAVLFVIIYNLAVDYRVKVANEKEHAKMLKEMNMTEDEFQKLIEKTEHNLKTENQESDLINSDIEVKDVSGEVYVNYQDLEEKLKKQYNNNQKLILKICESCDGIDYDNYEEAKCTSKELNINSISKLISKLKSSTKVLYVPTSKSCSITTIYNSDNTFVAFEADDPSILLVGVESVGLAYYYPDENIVEFLKSL